MPPEVKTLRLLVINYEMDDTSPVLAWQASIARELAKLCATVVVLTERQGRFHSLPNLVVKEIRHDPRPLQVEQGFPGIARSDIFQYCQRNQFNACFIHMAHKWAYRLYPIFFLQRIPTLLWYAHGTVTAHLRRAHHCATRVVTSTPEGFRIPSSKVSIIGQGVNTELFSIPHFHQNRDHIIYTGRVSRRKRIELLIRTMAELEKIATDLPFRLFLVGPLLTADDQKYNQELQELVEQFDLQQRVTFLGSISQQHHSKFYARSFLHLNVSATGSMDKTVLEALACGCPVLTSNEAFREILRPYPEFIVHDDNPQGIAKQILSIYFNQNKYAPTAMRALVADRHDQKSFAKKVFDILTEISMTSHVQATVPFGSTE